MAIINFYRYPLGVYFLVVTLITILSVPILLSNSLIFYRASKITLYLCGVIILLFCYHYGFRNFGKENPIEKIFHGASANGITSYLVVVLLNFIVISYILNKKTPILAILMVLAIALIGYGRASILSVLLVILLTIVAEFFSKNKYKVIFILAVFTSVGVHYFVKYNEEIILLYESKTKFGGSSFQSSHRDNMRIEYLNKLDYVGSLTGVDYSNTVIQKVYFNNPHNSFIRAHSIFGLPYIVIIFLIPIVIFIFYEKNKYRLYVAGVLVILYFRTFAEPIMFPSLLDFYFFSILLFPIFVNKGKSSYDLEKA